MRLAGPQAMVHGIRQELDTKAMRSVLGHAGLLDPDLDKSLAAIEQTARDLTEAGRVVTQQQHIGVLIDLLG